MQTSENSLPFDSHANIGTWILPDYFPSRKAECKDVTDAFFTCFTNHAGSIKVRETKEEGPYGVGDG
jgi:hypothetical protein